MAATTQAQRRRLALSSLGFIITFATMMPTATDADTHGSDSGGHSSGHAFAFAHSPRGATPSGAPQQAVAVPAGGTQVVAMSQGQPLPHSMFRHRHAIGSHVATLGYGGVWLNTYLYTPALRLERQPAANNALARNRAPSIKTPDPARRGIILVRGDSKSYVLFP